MIIYVPMSVEEIARTEEYRSIIEDYRGMCFWSFGDVSHPRTEAQLEMIFNAIDSYGDLKAYKRVGELRKWLSPDFNPKYSNGSPICA